MAVEEQYEQFLAQEMLLKKAERELEKQRMMRMVSVKRLRALGVDVAEGDDDDDDDDVAGGSDGAEWGGRAGSRDSFCHPAIGNSTPPSSHLGRSPPKGNDLPLRGGSVDGVVSSGRASGSKDSAAGGGRVLAALGKANPAAIVSSGAVLGRGRKDSGAKITGSDVFCGQVFLSFCYSCWVFLSFGYWSR